MKAEQLIYDTRRIPLWFSIPIFLAGLVCLFLAADVLCSHLLGFKLIPATVESGSPIIGFLAALALGLFFASIPFLRNRIFYDSSNNEVVVRHSGLFGRSARRIGTASATAVEIQSGRVLAASHWSIFICSGEAGKKRAWLTQLMNKAEAEDLGKALSEAAHLPLVSA